MLKTQVMGGFVVSHLPEQRVLLWLVVVGGGAKLLLIDDFVAVGSGGTIIGS